VSREVGVVVLFARKVDTGGYWCRRSSKSKDQVVRVEGCSDLVK
jgi:hypothetical protein